MRIESNLTNHCRLHRRNTEWNKGWSGAKLIGSWNPIFILWTAVNTSAPRDWKQYVRKEGNLGVASYFCLQLTLSHVRIKILARLTNHGTVSLFLKSPFTTEMTSVHSWIPFISWLVKETSTAISQFFAALNPPRQRPAWQEEGFERPCTRESGGADLLFSWSLTIIRAHNRAASPWQREEVQVLWVSNLFDSRM